MKSLLALAVLVIGATGCSSTQAAAPDPSDVSPEFLKAGKYAYQLLDQVISGHNISKSELSKAMADLKAKRVSLRESKAVTMLDMTRLYVENYHDSKYEAARLLACKQAAGDVFDEMLGDAQNFDKDYDGCMNYPAPKSRR